MKDFLGNEIHVGDEICYAAHWSNVAVLTHARVVAIDTDEPKDTWTRKAPLKVVALRRRYEIGKPSDRVVHLSFPDRCIVVKRAEAV